MPTVYIWSPNWEHPYGHASVQTNKYHISFWPDGDVKKDLGRVSAALGGVKGCLVFHPELDRFYEGNRLPTGMHQIVNTTDEAINSIHEEFLRYNSINPLQVTLEAAEKLLNESLKPERSVPETKYSYIAAVTSVTLFDSRLNVRGVRDPFYENKQSCVSFCFNVINGADPNPQVHMPVSQMMPSPSSPTEVSFTEFLFGVTSKIFAVAVPFIGRGQGADAGVGAFPGAGLYSQPSRELREPNGIFTVPWFENYVLEHWV